MNTLPMHAMPDEPVLLIADDHALIRIGLRTQLTHLGHFQVIEAWDQPSLHACVAREPRIDLILLDVMMPGSEDQHWIESFRQRFPEPRVLLITGLPLDQVTRRYRHLPNVLGVIDKSRSSAELRRAVDLALAGEPVWPSAGMVAPAYEKKGHLRAATLTERQREVAMLVASGLSNRDVATSLDLSEGTVKNHIKDIFRALGVTNRTQLALRVKPPDAGG